VITEEIITQISDIKALRNSAEPLQKVVRSLVKGEIKNFLHGTWLGHPLHAVLTDIPIGAWTTALVFDLIGEKEAADLAIGVGLAGAVASAVAGATDWSETDEPARNIGLLHGLLNIAATSMYTASYLMRKRRSRQNGIAMSMLGYATALTAAYLGGHLVFGQQIGVDHTATSNQNKPEKFTRAIATKELKTNKPKKVEVDGVSILLVKRNGQIYAITETCPHLGGPLSEGKLVGDAIECPWHGSQLALDDGHVVNGPTAYPARCFDVRVRGGYIEVRAVKRA
jgi:nitrite reductase/ring-hydroxylating ferredoxin subunit/uncharacterized membrane protein